MESIVSCSFRSCVVALTSVFSITDFNVVIIVLSMFVLLAKCVMYIMNVLPPFCSALLHACLTTLFAVSISQQAASDNSDPLHPSTVPWYLTHSCGPPVSARNYGYCMQAKASFGVTVALLYVYSFFLETLSK